MRDYPKTIKQALRKLATEAYERELSQELARLEQSFAEWRGGQIAVGDLAERIHVFYTGPSRELFNRYNSDSPDWCVALAVADGILSAEEVPAEVLDAIQGLVDFTRGQGSSSSA